MTTCQVGPRYCPKCGKELDHNVSNCMSCGYRIKKGKVKQSFFPVIKEQKVPKDEQI